MNPDQYFESDTDGSVPQDKQTPKPEPPAAGGATDIFGTVPAASATEWSTVREIPVSAPPPPAQEPVMSRTPPPVVHEVVFKGDSASADGSDPLRQLLRSAPPAPRPAEPLPQQPAAAASSGGFTQLLRALNYEQSKPAAAAPAVEEPVAPAAPPVPPPPATPARGSITQLLRTIDLSEMAQEALAPAPSSPAAPAAPVATASVVETTVQAALHVVEEVRPVASSPSVQVTSFRPETPAAPVADPVAPAPAAAGSFTQLFGTLDTSPARTAPVVETSAKPTPTGQGGFTQMFEALGTAKAAPPPVEAPAPAAPPVPSAPGSFTQMFQALDVPLAAHAPMDAPKVEAAIAEPPLMMAEALEPRPPHTETVDPPPAPAVPGSFTQMFQSPVAPQAQPAPVETPAAPARPPTDAVTGSFTQMFRSLDVVESQPHAAPSTEPFAGSATQSFQPLPPVVVETPPSAAAPGSFTQMFQSPVAPQAQPVPVETPAAPAPPPAAASPGSFTQMFRSLDAAAPQAASLPEASPASVTQSFQAPPSPPVAAPHTPPPAAPGSFTQMFSTLSSEPAVESRPQAPPQTAVPGSFTQMFRSLDAQPPEPARGSAPSTGAGAPGTFTQMFGTLNSPSAKPPRVDTPPARPEGGSFTQLFGTLSDTPPAQSAPLPTAFPPPPSHPPDFGAGGASQVFSTPREMPEPARGPAFSPSSNAGYGPPAGQPPPAAPVGGGLTQLLRTLDSSPQPTPSAAAHDPLHSSPQQPGAFTSAYGNPEGSNAYSPPAQSFPQPGPVSNPDATQAFRTPTAPAPLAAPPVSAGPSEFTRILNASSLRESLLRGGEAAAPAEAAAPPAAQAAPAMGLPPIAMPQVKMPTAPAMPSGGGAAPAPHWAAPTAPAVPQMPHVPQVKAPEVPKVAAPAAGKMQQMLPLLLILIIFLLVAVLVAVVILMKH